MVKVETNLFVHFTANDSTRVVKRGYVNGRPLNGRFVELGNVELLSVEEFSVDQISVNERRPFVRERQEDAHTFSKTVENFSSGLKQTNFP